MKIELVIDEESLAKLDEVILKLRDIERMLSNISGVTVGGPYGIAEDGVNNG